jgi:phosphohistidine swiveling domain-containing protein
VRAVGELAGRLPLGNPEVLVHRLLGLSSSEPSLRLSWRVLGALATTVARSLRLGAAYADFRERELATFRRRDLGGFALSGLHTRIQALTDMAELFSLHALGTGLYTSLYHALDQLCESPGTVLLGLGSLRFGSSAAALRDLAGGGSLEAFLDEYGHLGSGTIDVCEAPWREEPERVLALAQALRAQGETDGAAWRRGLAARRRHAVAEMAARLSRWQRPRFELLVRALQAVAPYRENFKFYAHRRLALLRECLLELGRRSLACPEDIFYVRNLREPSQAEADEARRQVTRQRRWAYPLHRVEGPRGARAYFSSFSQARELQGTPGSPGVARGRARVLLSLQEGARLQPGEILVVPTTDPSWTPLLSLAAAVVVEVGSALSHGAVVAREIGVPAVLGLPGILAVVRDGQELEVDGGRGIVRLAGDERRE